MTDRRVTRAIVLAAGMGSRLSESGVALPKPLREVAGVPLLVRVLTTLQAAGIAEAVIVLGHRGDIIRRRLRSEPGLGLELTFVDNLRYQQKNGVSLLAAADHVDEDVILTMSDHLYSPELVRTLLSASLPHGVCALGVDYDIERCFDLDDATKVKVASSKICEIDKALTEYNAIDTGVFRVGPALIEALRDIDERDGDCSLSDGVRLLAERGQFHACDIDDVRWIDVDTPEALERAEAMIRVFGDTLGDEPGSVPPPALDPEAIELFSPTWVRAAKPYNEDHFTVANSDARIDRMMANENPFPPSPRVVNAILEAALRGNLYPGRDRELREKIAVRDGLCEANVLLGAGSTELIDVIIRSFVAPGEEVLLTVPTFSMYEARTRVVGGIPVLVPTTDDGEYDVPALIRAVTERTKVIFICSPNNPTGNLISEGDLRRILRLGLPTVVDEAYVEFGASGTSSHLLAEFPNAIVLRTFSKAFGLAGMRLGYLLSHSAVVHLLERVKVPWNIPAVTLAAASAALDDAAEFDARILELRALRGELIHNLALIPGLRMMASEANFVVVDISCTGLSAEQTVARLLEQGVLIRALSVHHATKSHVRITVGSRDQNRRCAEAFARVCAARAAVLGGVPDTALVAQPAVVAQPAATPLSTAERRYASYGDAE